jgi:hypothetical protein
MYRIKNFSTRLTIISLLFFIAFTSVAAPLYVFAEEDLGGTCYCEGLFMNCNSSFQNCHDAKPAEACYLPGYGLTKPEDSFRPIPPIISKKVRNNATGENYQTTNMYATSQTDCENLAPYLNEYYGRNGVHLGGSNLRTYDKCYYSPGRDEGCSKIKKSIATKPQTADDIIKKLELKKPILEILIPNLKFTDIQNTVDENGNIQIPWIGEYIKAIYKLGVSIASILGVLLVIKEGVVIIVSAGGDEKIAGYKNIGRIMTGLILAWLSYVILYNINSDLTSIQSLKVQLIEDSNSIEEEPDEVVGSAVNEVQITKNVVNSGSTKRSNGIYPIKLKPKWESGKFFKELCQTYRLEANPPPYGTVDPDLLEKNYTCPGISGTITTIPEMKDGLCRVGQVIKEFYPNEGYSLRVSPNGGSFRSFKGQVETYCKKWDEIGRQPNPGAIATPGYSNHGHGTAIDLSLMKNGKDVITAGKFDSQCGFNAKYVHDIADILYRADPDNFYRLETEVWHFEYGKNGASNRIKTYDFPKKCAGAKN